MEEALDRIKWRTHFERGFGPVVWQITDDDDDDDDDDSFQTITSVVDNWMSVKNYVERYWQEKTEKLGEKTVSVPLRTPQIPHRLGRRITAWAMAHQNYGTV
jgi:hypothetical protein